jgi:hypothetical protein
MRKLKIQVQMSVDGYFDCGIVVLNYEPNETKG